MTGSNLEGHQAFKDAMQSGYFFQVCAPIHNSARGLFSLWLVLTALFFGAPNAARAQSLAPDDVLSVTVLTYPELSVERVTVSAAGTINLPVAGQVKVTGKTPSILAREIARRLNSRVVNPEVTVSLREASLKRVFVLGGVVKPGVYDIKAGWRISEVLAAAGGLTGRLDETRATLSRPSQVGQKPIPIDLSVALGTPSSSQNRAVRAGDVVVVLDPQYVTVSGDVEKQGTYPLRRARRLLDILVAAGGPKQPSNQSRGFLLRGGKRIPLDLPAAMQYRDFRANIALLPGDLISIEAIQPLQITVNGLVKNPGNYPLPPGSGVLQAIAQAGGQTVTSERAVVSVRRGDALLPVDATRAAYDPQSDIRLQDGDLVQLSEPQIIRVQVTGQIRTPGELRVAPASTVLDAISRAGGLSITSEAARIAVIRSVGARQVALNVNAASLLSGTDLSQNTVLQEGDVVSVSNVAARAVIVSGEVTRPGSYELREGEGVAQLIARAGGQTPLAKLRAVQIQRGGESRTVDALAAVRTGQSAPEQRLQENDFVVVPENRARVLVTPEVNRPGYVVIPEDRPLTIGEALSLAGGVRDRAKLNKVTIYRRVGGEGYKSREVRLDKIERGNLGYDQTLAPNDVIFVAVGGASSASRSIGTAVSAFTTLRFLGAF